MNEFYYYKSFRKTIVGFLDLFNDIKIAKYNSNGDVIKYIDVPIKFMPKQKYYEHIFDRKHEKRLPMMGAEITSISYDSSRKTGKHEQVKVTDTEKTYYQTPSPYNIEFELKVATEYMVEMEQITTQILPYFDPTVFVSLDIDEIDEIWNVPVTLNSVSIDQDSNIDISDLRTVLWSFTFTVETDLLRPISNDASIVKKIIHKIYTNDDAWDKHSIETQTISGGTYDAEELYIAGYKDDDGKILYNYEVFN